MSDAPSLLPPGATRLEGGIEAAIGRVADVPTPLSPLWDPATCPAELLPWLAWALSVDTWNTSWPEQTKRAAIAGSIDEHRRKGSRYSLERVLARHDALLRIAEWFEAEGADEAHVLRVILPMVTDAGIAPGGERATAAFAEKVMADIIRTKPLREHLEFVQLVDAAGMIGVQGVARGVMVARTPVALGTDDSQPWATLLDDENGEPLQADDGSFLDTAP